MVMMMMMMTTMMIDDDDDDDDNVYHMNGIMVWTPIGRAVEWYIKKKLNKFGGNRAHYYRPWWIIEPFAYS